MKEVLKFAGFFVLTYLVLLGLYQFSVVKGPLNKSLRFISTVTCSSSFPSADISQQNLKDRSNSDSEMYLIYGNPYLIRKAMEDARSSGQRYATIPTRSLELHLFEMFVVPIFFILSIFIATPLRIKEKLKGISITMVSIIIFILFKLCLLTLFEMSNARIGVYELGDSAMNFLSRLLGIFSLGFTLMLGFILWLIFGFRNSKFVEQFNALGRNV
ncbi:MAG: hypothetical protein IT267_01640 [Saprospiraceae bacterium]|nr:hypothetical protein [Saprospiraceae bacterium]